MAQAQSIPALQGHPGPLEASRLDFVRRLLRRPLSGVAMGYVLLVIFVALATDLIAPYDPLKTAPMQSLDPPSMEHPLGLDRVGRDQLSRLLYGARVSLIVGLGATAIGLTIGVPLGLISGYRGGRVDDVIMRFVDAAVAFPSLLLAMALLLAMGGGVLTVCLALGIPTWGSKARIVRSVVLSAKERDYVIAAVAMGAGPWRITFQHIAPNVIAPAIVNATLSMGFAILGEASLSFLGVGVTPPTPTWGGMLNMAFQSIDKAPWLTVAPGVAIFLLVLSFNFLGDGLRDVLDPRLRGAIK